VCALSRNLKSLVELRELLDFERVCG